MVLLTLVLFGVFAVVSGLFKRTSHAAYFGAVAGLVFALATKNGSSFFPSMLGGAAVAAMSNAFLKDS